MTGSEATEKQLGDCPDSRAVNTGPSPSGMRKLFFGRSLRTPAERSRTPAGRAARLLGVLIAVLPPSGGAWADAPDGKVLRCAYRRLPRSLSPFQIRTPVERHAASLIYESLVCWVDDAKSGPHYQCELARAAPIPLERGRAFYLPDGVWSDSDQTQRPCTWTDVRRTFEVWKDRTRPGYSPAWSGLVVGVRSVEGAGQLGLEIRLTCDHWQPLALMDVKILPGHRLPACTTPEQWQALQETLDGSPVGTGPYKLAERTDKHLRLVANPFYHHRRQGLPKIKEIVFEQHPPQQSVELFAQGKLDLVYDVPAEQLKQRDSSRWVALRTPSVWFLAPNYQPGSPLRNTNLRLAVAHAIDRQEILDLFRHRRDDHAVVNGPYPLDSWAYKPEWKVEYRPDKAVPESSSAPPFVPRNDSDRAGERGLAKGFAVQAKKQFQGRLPALELSYPAGNPQLEQACRMIRQQVRDHAGIDIKLEPVEETRFYDQVVNRHEFELAYWRHDFEDPTYWLGPLLDQSKQAQAPGGPNFMSYTQDAATDLDDKFRQLNDHKRFGEIERLTHEIHELVTSNAIIIPLWQLDTYVAVSRRLAINNAKGPVGRLQRKDLFRNLDLFRDVEHWELKAGPSR